MNFVVGQVVISGAGRDKSRYLVVIETEPGYVYVADGKLRKMETPKRKNIKHLFSTDTVFDLSVIQNNKHLRGAIVEKFGADHR